MSKINTVTSIEESPEVERRRRFLIYTVSMVIRFASVVLVVFTTGIWQWIFGLCAVFLPYFAVVIGNNSGGPAKSTKTAVRIEPLAIDVASHIKEKN
jgi:predicted tellurium resistance membrane protein TerC